MHNVIAFEAASSWVIVGSNPEMADMDNPRGEIIGLSYAVRARNEHGDTWERHVVTGRIGEETALYTKAERLAVALQARLERLGKLPVDAAQWQPGRTVYGSGAYVEYGSDDELALERREAEEEGWLV